MIGGKIKALKHIQTGASITSLSRLSKDYAYVSYTSNQLDLVSIPQLEIFDLAQLPFASKVTCIISLSNIKFAVGTDAGIMVAKAKSGQVEASST
jgi:hypothetical protein